MHTIGRFLLLGIASLLTIGCQTITPIGITADAPDPFRLALIANHPPVAQVAFDTLAVIQIEPSEPQSEDCDPIHTDADSQSSDCESENCSEEEPEFEFEFESNRITPLSEAEQTELLSQNQWSKNFAAINLADSGKTSSSSGISAAERQQREQRDRLNQTRQEQANRQNRQFVYIDPSASDWRWLHRGIDKLQAIPPENRVSPEIFLRNKYRDQKILQANAAILLGRDGDPKAGRLLLQLVQSESVPLNIRCAAAEVLGRMPTITAEDLIPLLDNVKDRTVETVNRQTGEQIRQHRPGIAEIWEELLIAIAEKIAPWEHECFLEPFDASVANIRIETAKLWRRKSLQNLANGQRPEGTLPDKFLEIARREPNQTARAEIIRTLGAWRVPDLYKILENDLTRSNRTAEVRNAAMIALAESGSQESIPVIKDQLRDSGPNRAVAVSALRKLGAFDEMLKMSSDTDFRVRVEVAKALSDRCTPQTALLARTYIADRSRDVQSAALEAVGSWSIEESGALFLTAAKSMHPNVRHQAVDMLMQRDVFYSGFDPDARPDSQTAQFQELVHIFRNTFGFDPILDADSNDRTATAMLTPGNRSANVPDEAILAEVRRCLDDWSDRTLPQTQRQLIHHRLTKHGTRLMPAIDHIMTVEKRNILESLDRVFAEVDPMFWEIEKLRSLDITAKRNAARELARLGALDTPSKLASKRIIDLTARENDPMVLASLLSALKNADPDLVCQLARPLLQSESPEVRRVSCGMLQQFGSSEDIPLLQELLRDPNRVVVRGALSAIDALWDETADNASVLATLKTLLHQGDASLQTDVAATLHRLGQSEGTAAIRRLAASSDYRVKVHVAGTVSGLEDDVFVDILLRFLDDSNATVRNEALKGLPRLVGEDIGRSGTSANSTVAQTQQQIDRWKAWGRERR
ncbi:MAG: HEAT repeat domain-containing protein [Planctomycetaceae bacterium]|nr:HEAT repeat domain-containing protein [Planctomycetaceae bacterium]